MPRITKKQIHRANVPVDCAQNYFKITIVIQYLDSLLSSLKERFSVENEVPYSLLQLSPEYLIKLDKQQYTSLTNNILEKYGGF